MSGLIIGALSKWAPSSTCIPVGAAGTSTGTGRGILLAPLIAIPGRSISIIAKMCACALAIIFRVWEISERERELSAMLNLCLLTQ